MKLDYQLLNHINNHNVDGAYKYDYVYSSIWFRKQELCDEVGKLLNINIPLETQITVTKEQMKSVWKLLGSRNDLVGVYGDKFLND